MKLTKNHRASLLNALEAANKEHELHKHCMDKATSTDDKEWFETKHFLSQLLIKNIQDALIANDIDY